MKERENNSDDINGKTELLEKNKRDYIYLFEILEESKLLIDELDEKFLLKEWFRLNSRINSTQFSLGVVGEFSRGKSTIVNKLLGDNIVPIGTLPTTAILTKIVYGRNPKIYLNKENEQAIVFPLEENSWKKILKDYKNEKLNTFVEVILNNDWIKETGISIIDTPGAGDISERKAEKTLDTIASCDCALIAINATMPISLTEKLFIHQHIISKKVPRIGIVITNLDRISKEEKLEVVEYIKNQVKMIEENINICTSEVIENIKDKKVIMGIDHIKNIINNWATSEGATGERNIQIAFNVIELLNKIRKVVLTKKKAIDLSNHEKNIALKTAKNEMKQKELDWEDLKLQMKNKGLLCSELIKRKLLMSEDEIIRQLEYEFNKATNPKIWWQEDLQFRLRELITSVALTIKESIEENLSKDILWLDNKVEKQFETKVNLSEKKKERQNIEADQYIEIIPEGEEIKSLNTWRLYTRIGLGATTFSSLVLFSPIALAVSVGLIYFNEKSFNSNIEIQKEELRFYIKDIVNHVIRKTIEISSQRINNMYSRAVLEIEDEEIRWLKVKEDLMTKENKIDQDSLISYDKLLKKIDDIYIKAKGWLEKEGKYE